MKQRLFVALDLPADVREALPSPGEGWRAVAKESLHVTLAFLGWMEEADVPRVVSAVSSAIVPIGGLTATRAVLLPPRRPRVMAVELAGEVGGLQAAVSASLARAGLYEPEARPFLAHVTIARARGRVGREVPAVAPLRFSPPSVSVYRSHLGAGGARYEALARFGL